MSRRLREGTEAGGAADGLAVGVAADFGVLVTEVDEAMAASVRSRTPIIVGDLEIVEIEIDGFRRSQSNVWVRRIGIDDDWIKADVRDPSFEAYSNAASSGKTLFVAAKPTYKDHAIYKLFILHTAEPDGSSATAA